MHSLKGGLYKWGLKVTRLTEQEIEIMQLFAQGKSTRETAEEMGIHHTSVTSSLAKIRRKLGARNTLHAVVIAIRQKLI